MYNTTLYSVSEYNPVFLISFILVLVFLTSFCCMFFKSYIYMKYIPQELQTLEEIPPAYENNVEDPYPVPSYEQVKTDL
jgi:hypothetical protein